MMFNDKNFNDSEQLIFDLANRDGILGDRFLVNGRIQPYFEVKRRRYRFRLLNGGPSRFYQFFLTRVSNNTSIPFFLIANDGNLLPEIEILRRKLGFSDGNPKLDKDLNNHIGMVKYGNERRQWWAMFPGKGNPAWMVKSILWMDERKKVQAKTTIT